MCLGSVAATPFRWGMKSRAAVVALVRDRVRLRHYSLNSIETIAGYRHPAVDQASNPLDDLVARAPP